MITTTVFDEALKAYNAGFRIIALRGGTRSSKTFSILQLFKVIMDKSKRQRIISTVSHSFPHLYGGAIRDFEKILELDNIDTDSIRQVVPRQYHINKSIHEFIGFDKPGKALGAARDILLINEANKMPFSICHQLMQRTTECIFLDWNPSDEFWFDTEGFANRPDTCIIDSTFKNNIQNISAGQLQDLKAARNKALAEDRTGKRGYWWNWWQVYGLGLKGQLEGVIFQNWTTYKELPIDVDLFKMWVIDWGGNDPTTLSELFFDGKNNNLYIKEHIYQPQILNSKLIEYLHTHNSKNDVVICDSARKDKIFELQMSGINALGATKGEGSIIDGIERLQEFSIFIHEDSINAIDEFSKYKRVQDKITGKYLDIPEDAHNHCFIGSTKITTNLGLKRIDRINEYDLVLTSEGYKQVLYNYNNGIRQVNKYLLQFDTFLLSLSCTNTHEIKTSKGWIQISALKSGMMVYLTKSLTEKYSSYTQKKGIFQEALKGCTPKYGSILMVLLKKVAIFTIRMLILGIIKLAILILKRVTFIKENVQKNGLKIILNLQKNLIEKEERLQKYGTDQTMVGNGIRNNQNGGGLIERLKHLYVSIAEKNIRQDIQESQNTVMQIVKHVHCENEGEKQVYDLMVEGCHEYFANGILVHNCIDPARYGARFYRRSIKPL